MVATPGAGSVDPTRALLDRISALEQTVANLANKTLYSASIGSGGITINGGEIVIANSGGIQLPLGGAITDQSGNILFSADRVNGSRLSTPSIPVPLYPEFGNRTTGHGYMTALASDIGTTETQIWEGQLPQVTHSGIHWRFLGGDLTASTNTTTYRLYVNGSMVDSFSAAGQTVRDQSIFAAFIAATPTYGTYGVGVAITAQCTASNSNQIGCQLISCNMVGQ